MGTCSREVAGRENKGVNILNKVYKVMLTGPSGSGKDTMADLITDSIHNCHRLSFASELKLITDGVLQYLEKNERISLDLLKKLKSDDEEQWRLVMRPFWQWLGTDIVRDTVDKDFWIRRVANQMNFVKNFSSNHYEGSTASFVVTDCRFQNECQWGIDNDFVIVRISGQWRQSSGIPGHSSEHEHTELMEHLWYKNQGSLEDMRTWVNEVLLPFCDAISGGCDDPVFVVKKDS
jgi:hypothetical protein